jgi:hypothetical protein
MLIAFMLTATQVQAPAAAAEPVETRCDHIASDGRVERAPELHVLRQTAGAGPYAPPIPPGAAIRCGRSDIVPAANDWKVIAAGHALYIVEARQGTDSRIAALEIVGGHIRFRFLAGRLTEAEAPRIQARLDAFQLHFQE